MILYLFIHDRKYVTISLNKHVKNKHVTKSENAKIHVVFAAMLISQATLTVVTFKIDQWISGS